MSMTKITLVKLKKIKMMKEGSNNNLVHIKALLHFIFWTQMIKQNIGVSSMNTTKMNVNLTVYLTLWKDSTGTML